MKRFVYIIICLFFIIITGVPETLQAQEKANQKRIEKQAAKHLNAKEWYFALPLYLQLSELEPSNAYYAFSTGKCFFNTDNKAEGLKYFQKAYQNLQPPIQSDIHNPKSEIA